MSLPHPCVRNTPQFNQVYSNFSLLFPPYRNYALIFLLVIRRFCIVPHTTGAQGLTKWVRAKYMTTPSYLYHLHPNTLSFIHSFATVGHGETRSNTRRQRLTSSDMSLHSGSPSHLHSWGRQAPLPQRNCVGWQVRAASDGHWRSSEPPSQSASPSHTQSWPIDAQSVPSPDVLSFVS